MQPAFNDTVDLLKWLKTATPQEIYDEASKTTDTQAAFNMCDHLVCEVPRESPVHVYARLLKAKLFLKLDSKPHALKELSFAIGLAQQNSMPSDDPHLLEGAELLAKLTPKKKPKQGPEMPKDLVGVLAAMHKLCNASDFNPPCTEEQLRLLRSAFSDLPGEVEEIFKDHNGCRDLPSVKRSELSLAAAIVPVESLSETQQWVCDALKNEGIEPQEKIAWLWFDAGGNYAGIFLSGANKGSITKFFHEVPEVRPSYSSVYEFMATILKCGQMPDEDDRPCDISMLPEIK